MQVNNILCAVQKLRNAQTNVPVICFFLGYVREKMFRSRILPNPLLPQWNHAKPKIKNGVKLQKYILQVSYRPKTFGRTIG